MEKEFKRVEEVDRIGRLRRAAQDDLEMIRNEIGIGISQDLALDVVSRRNTEGVASTDARRIALELHVLLHSPLP